MLQGTVHSQQHDPDARKRTLRFPGLIWLLSLLICVLASAVAFVYFDVPIARSVFGMLGATDSLARGFASAVLLTGEAAVALTLIVFRIARGHLSPFFEAAALACLTSICAYAINDSALKLFFGVPNPITVLHGAPHVFHPWKGASTSGFPSGHMVLASSFAGVFMRLYRRSIPLFTVLLLIAAVVLIVGDWHFVSDVITGGFLGVTAGLLAGEVWRAHSREYDGTAAATLTGGV